MSNELVNAEKRIFYPQLTSVRFIAAFMVVLYHYRKELSDYLPNIFVNIINHGYVGVSFFFVLSGFILSTNYYDRLLAGTVTKQDFWWARFSRLYPLYLLSILVVLPRWFLPLRFDPYPEQAIHAHTYPLETFSVAFLALQALPFESGFFNAPAWSISTEIFFYICLPFLLPIISRISTKRLVIALIFLMFLALLAPFCYHNHIFMSVLPRFGWTYTPKLDYILSQYLHTSFLTRLPEFIIGIICYRLHVSVLKKGLQPRHIIIGILTSLPFLLVLFFEPDIYIANTILYSGQFLGIPFYSFLILWLVNSKSIIIDQFSRPTWLLLGESSFALYLFHVPIKQAAYFVSHRFLPGNTTNLLFWIVTIIFSIFVSIILFKIVETPCRKQLTFYWRNRK
jgi:peptidoglycan/LPS O-acetylase OafA/YrhL